MKPDRGQKVQSFSVQSPIGGINAKEGLSAMPPSDAVILENLFPEPGGVSLRKGSANHVTGFASPVESLMPYHSAIADKLFAASGTGIYDATASGTVGDPVMTGTSARYQHINFGTSGGQYLYCVNGVDAPKLFNGTNWQHVTDGVGKTISSLTRSTVTVSAVTSTAHGLVSGQYIVVGGCTPSGYNGTWSVTVIDETHFNYTVPSDPGACTIIGTYASQIAISGISTTLFISVNSFGARLWFTEKNSCRVWYLPAASVGGSATSIDFSSQFKLGGYLAGMCTWSIESTSALSENAVFVSSEGEVLVYGGQDPASSSTWGLVAHFRMGKPIGRRFWVKTGSNVILLTSDGFYPLDQAMLTDRSQQKIAISDKIQNMVGTDIANYQDNFGWCILIYPIGSKLVINVPEIEGGTQNQYVLNTLTNGWTKYTGWNANCFADYDNRLFYGGKTAVVECDILNADNGLPILGKAIQAFSNFGNSQVKRFSMIRPLFRSESKPAVTVSVNTDFDLDPPSHMPSSFEPTSQTTWDAVYWDTSQWSSPASVNYAWASTASIGTYAAISMYVMCNGFSVSWVSTDFQFSQGGPL